MKVSWCLHKYAYVVLLTLLDVCYMCGYVQVKKIHLLELCLDVIDLDGDMDLSERSFVVSFI